MIREGQVVLFPFPQTDQTTGKLRPALVLRHVPGPQHDWLVCMVSSQLRHELPDVDEVIHASDADFRQSGLKGSSLIRATRLAVVSGGVFHGAVGSLDADRMTRIRSRIAEWIVGAEKAKKGRQP